METFKSLNLSESATNSENVTEEITISKQEELSPGSVAVEMDFLVADADNEEEKIEGDVKVDPLISDKEEANEFEKVICEKDSIDQIQSILRELIERVSAMELLFNKRIMHTDYEDKVIDQMHSELKKYKEDLYSQLVRPILLDIIEVRDSITRISSAYLEKPEGEKNIPNKTFSDYAYDLQDILEKNNVEIYKSERGDDFIPIKQRVVKKEITADESLHGKIAESLSGGYIYGGRVISAEKVVVYFYQVADEAGSEREEILNG